MLCSGGKLHIAACNSFRGEAGKQFKEELEKTFGDGNVVGHEKFVSISDDGGSFAEVSDYKGAKSIDGGKADFKEAINDPGRYIPRQPRP